jgi:hypothetical protein
MRTNYTLPFNSLPIELQEQRLRRREKQLLKNQEGTAYCDSCLSMVEVEGFLDVRGIGSRCIKCGKEL